MATDKVTDAPVGTAYKKYPSELKARAVAMCKECRASCPNDSAAMRQVAELLGVSSGEQIRQWVRRDEVDHGDRPGLTSEESAEIKRLKRENAELRRANAILKAASAFFAAELDRPGA